MEAIKKFQISVQLAGRTHVERFQVAHRDETFEVELFGNTISLLNNGDNSWSQLKGDQPQEWINALGEAIEQQVRKMP